MAPFHKDHQPGSADGPRRSYFRIAVDAFFAAIVIGLFLFLPTQLPEIKSYAEHLQLTGGGLFLLLCCGFLITVFLDKKPTPMVSNIGLALTVFILVCASLLIRLLPGADAHIAHSANRIMAQRALMFILEHRADGQDASSETVLKQLGDTRFGRHYRVQLLRQKKIDGCPTLDAQMTVHALTSYINQFDPHCMDDALGMHRAGKLSPQNKDLL